MVHVSIIHIEEKLGGNYIASSFGEKKKGPLGFLTFHSISTIRNFIPL